MKFLAHLTVFILVISLFTSCEKEINVPLVQGSTRLVVEGSISTDQFPVVALTKSVGFFEKIDFSKITYVSNATVLVTDLTDNKSISLIEYKIDSLVNGNQFSFAIYAPDTTHPNLTHFLSGKIGHRYKLDIQVGNQSYTAETIIPHNTGLDSVWLEPSVFAPDSFSVLKVIYDDPDTLGNSSRYKTMRKRMVKRDDETFLKSFNPNFDDEIINGSRFPFNLDMGVDPAEVDFDFQRALLVQKGDTVTIQWSAIDKSVYNFWNTFEFAQGSVGNPFASPTQIQSNVSNNALGVWAGYAHNYYTIIDSL